MPSTFARVRDRGSGANERSRSFLSQAMRVAAKAKGGPSTLGEMRGARLRPSGMGRGLERCERCPSRLRRSQRAPRSILIFRRQGKRLPLPSPYNSPKFLEGYWALRNGEAPKAEIGAARPVLISLDRITSLTAWYLGSARS